MPEEVGRLLLHGLHALGGHDDVEGNGTKGEVRVTR